MATMEELNSKRDAYLQTPQGSLDLSGMGLDAEGAKKVAAFLPQW
jgi:hypothetical protein